MFVPGIFPILITNHKEMFSWFKSKRKDSSESEALQKDGVSYKYQWHEIGQGNPFNKRVLDVRSFTLSMIATTSKKEVAEKYTSLRTSIGEEYIGAGVPNPKSVLSSLKYPHNGAAIRGAVFKAESMDCKWDIYCYDDVFYFTRSWTGDLIYKVKAKINADSVELTSIEYPLEIDELLAINNVHFLLLSHALGRIFPHMVPKELVDENDVALYSFSTFGNKACYACYEPVTDTVVTLPKR